MKNRYSRIVFEAESGITFAVLHGPNGELIIRAKKIIKSDSENFQNPPIPEGYRHIKGEWNNGFVIERCSDGSQFVWIPVDDLDCDGTLDGIHFSEKFGRRNYNNNQFFNAEYNEEFKGEFFEQCESVKRYGGFYISRYHISKSSDGMPQAKEGALPWVDINYTDAMKVASSMEDSEHVKSHLLFGSEYDSVLAWLIKSNKTTIEDTKSDKKVIENGYINNIYNFADSVEEWTQERKGYSNRVIRGISSNSIKSANSKNSRSFSNPDSSYHCTSFRIALCIK